MSDPLSNKTTERKMNEQPSYPMIVAVDVSAVDWVASDEGTTGMFVCEMRNKVLGDICVDTVNSANVIYPADDYDVLRDRITKIRNTNTTATGITVHGYPLGV